jgi:SAM-dependent methyltransferase
MNDPATPYRPRDFWQERLSGQFDLRGTGHPGLSAEYNARCYDLRAYVLDRALARNEVRVAGRRVLDAGSGTGFFVEHFLERGADVTGVDLTEVSARELSRRFPAAHFEVGDLAEWRPSAAYDLVSCFDVLFHIVDDERWDRALTNLADAVAPGGWFVFTEMFPRRRRPRAHEAAHNVVRGWEAYRPALHARGLAIVEEAPTHHLLNSELGPFRFLNRFPDFLYRVDLALLMTGALEDRGLNRLVLCRRPEGAPAGVPPAPPEAAA